MWERGGGERPYKKKRKGRKDDYDRNHFVSQLLTVTKVERERARRRKGKREREEGEEREEGGKERKIVRGEKNSERREK